MGRDAPRRLLAIALLVGVTLVCASCFSRMKSQRSIKPYEQVMPPMPAGVIPREDPGALGGPRDVLSIVSPIPDSPESRSVGAAYYGHYCSFCHGTDGIGNTQVGRGFIPKPADLTSDAVQSMTDSSLVRAMVEGSGHEPVMRSTVPTGRRWYIAVYLRALP